MSSPADRPRSSHFNVQRELGRTGVEVGRLGIASSYRAPAAAYEEAFERGCNYFSWGTFIKGRDRGMRDAIRNVIEKGRRDELVISLWAYSHSPLLIGVFLERALKALGTDRIDVLMLGYYPGRPSRRTIDKALALKDQGKIRFIGLSSHNRRVFPQLAEEGLFDVFHVRYNAAHRGAEEETFPFLAERGDDRPGVVSFTATRWGKLLKQKAMPPGERALSAADCYRFALAHPAVDVCMVGARDRQQLQHALTVLDLGPLDAEELARVRRIGDHVYGRR